MRAGMDLQKALLSSVTKSVVFWRNVFRVFSTEGSSEAMLARSGMQRSLQAIVLWITTRYFRGSSTLGPMHQQADRTMRKFSPLLLCLLLFACTKGPGEKGFVVLREGAFEVHGKPFFPIALNYVVSSRASGNELWAGPAKDYARMDPNATITKESSLASLRADMELIREAGFNTVRLVGIGELARDREGVWLPAYTVHDADTLIELGWKDPLYLNALDEALKVVEEAGLRTILLTTVHEDAPSTATLFKMVADHFANDTSIFAFDLFNEPLYFDGPERPKSEVLRITQGWRKMMRDHAPNHLYTVGLTGIRETFEFDPNILGVDFISFHPYEYEPDQVRNEMRWYHNNVEVPWIIGETAIPADNDSVPYEEQRQFALSTMKQSRACGAIGYSWWHFQDVAWGRFHADYMGVLDREGVTRTKSGAEVRGTPKPVMKALTSFDPWADPGECICLPNYLNYSNGKVSKITGRLIDEHGDPINEGTIIGWNEHWSSSYHTTSGPDGRFELRGSFFFHHWMVSATRHDMERGDCDPVAFKRGPDGIPAYELGDIVVERLSL